MSNVISNPPDASALMTTARSLGNYDLAGALADLIDNSIKAQASEISITCDYNEGVPEVRIRDDGYGMSASELRAAMRPASTHPAELRAVDDLGRFGWGMKSASFSQCKCVTVISKKAGRITGAAWDLDDIDDWSMTVLSSGESSGLLKQPFPGTSGTELIWTKCDRLSEDSTLGFSQFNELIVAARSRLSVIFHRYLRGSHGASKLPISVNGTPLEEIDPFYTRHPATQALPEETVVLRTGEIIRLRAYTLPHYSKLRRSEYETLGGEEGYVKNQGFYIHRNNRLIIWGTWFRLAKHGELSKLVRISIDISNDLDTMWKITVDKSDVQLPAALKSRLKDLIENFREKSVRVFQSRGGSVDNNSTVSVWSRHVKKQQIRYSVNRDHPLLENLLDRLDGDDRTHVQAVLKLIENYFPVDAIFSDASSDPRGLSQSATGREEFDRFIRDTVPLLLSRCDDPAEIAGLLKNTEPYASNWGPVEEYLKSRGLI